MDAASPAEAGYDRATEDLGNIVELGHVNVRVPDQRLATAFYVSGLGLTRDPYLMTGIENMWVNAGRSQFHLPAGAPQVLGGRVGLVVPDPALLLHRLAGMRRHLDGTRFAFEERAEGVEVICPWGNRLACHAPDARLGRVNLGIPYVAFDVPPGTAAGIARFYREIFDVPADAEGGEAGVLVGVDQHLLFRETEAPLRPFDGAHVQITLADFSGPYRRLRARRLVSEESSQHQYRFQDIVDLDSGQVLFTFEHEVRSMRHPLYARPLINRDPTQTPALYTPGHEDWAWTVPAAR